MIPLETVVQIRQLFHAEHWKVGTIAAELGLHPDAVRNTLDTGRFHPLRRQERRSLTDPYVEFIRKTLDQYPKLRATRIHAMVRDRGYGGSVCQLRRVVRELRPKHHEAFLRLRTFPGEQAQVDWAHFGTVRIGRAERKLSGFVLTLSWSRALYLEFFFDQKLESFLLGHVRAFQDLGGVPRVILTDNLRSAVLERRGNTILVHPQYLGLCSHYCTSPRACRPARGNEKGRVERAIQYVRHSFFAARPFTTLADFNAQALRWRDEVAHVRPHPIDDSKTVGQAFEEEKPRLLPLAAHPFETDLVCDVRAEKEIYVRFDRNDYSIPPTAVGRDLQIAASPDLVRILDGAKEIARHRRSYDRGNTIDSSDHREALLAWKRNAQGSLPSTRLCQAVPETEAFLEAALARQIPSAGQIAKLLRLLDEYGAPELQATLTEALARKTPTLDSVQFILERRRRVNQRRPPLTVDLSHRPELADLHVQPHNLETYDDLAKNDTDD